MNTHTNHRVQPLTVGVYDAGIGGIPIASMLRARRPDLGIVYLGDSARRPYGPQPASSIRQYVAEAEQFMAKAGVDAWVIACNTASVVASSSLKGLLPVVDMVSAAISGVPENLSTPIGVIGTTGTVESGAYQRALAPREVRALATEDLLRLAEYGGGDDPVLLDRLAAEAVAPFLDGEVLVLACTDYTAILPTLERAVDGRTHLLDPAELAVDQLIRLLPEPAGQKGADRLFFTGDEPLDTREWALREWGLALPRAERVSLG